MDEGPITVGDYIAALSKFPHDWPVRVSTPAGGGIAIEHREIDGAPVIAVFGSNGGRFGENPLTEEEYKKQVENFLVLKKTGYRYTSIHGDHSLYDPCGGSNATCYGKRFDPRIIERMIAEGLISIPEFRARR